MKFIKYIIFIISLLFFIACDNNKITLSDGSASSHELENSIDNIDIKSYAGLEDTFLNTKEISSSKQILIIFGQNGCYYCEKLKKDIKNNEHTRNYIKNNFNAYYLNLSYAKRHYVEFLNKTFSTNALSRMYNVGGTPLIYLIEKNGEEILRAPGYPGVKTFQKMLEFANIKYYGETKGLNERMKLFEKYARNISR